MWRKNGLVSPDIVPAAGTFGMFSFGRDFVRTGVSPVCIHHIERLLFRGGGGRVPRIYELFIRSTYTKLMAAIWLRAYTSTRGAQMSRQQFSNPLATKEKSGSWLGRGVRLVQTGNFASQTLTTFSFFSSAVLRKCRKGNHRQNVDIRRTKRNSKSCSDRSFFFFFSFSSTLPTGKCVACCRNYPLDGQREELTNRRRRWLSRLQRDEEEEEEVERKDRRVFIRERAFGWFSRCVQQLVPALHSLGAPPPPIFFCCCLFFFLKKKKKKKIYIIPPVSLSLCVCVRESAWACSPPETYHHPRLCLCSRFSVCVCFFFFSSRHFFFFFGFFSRHFRPGRHYYYKKNLECLLLYREVGCWRPFFFCLKDIFIFGWRHVAVLNPDFSFSSFWVSTTFWKKQKTNRSKRVCVLFARPPPGLLASRSIFSAVEKSSRCNPMLSGQIWNQQPCRRTFAVHFVDREREDTHTQHQKVFSLLVHFWSRLTVERLFEFVGRPLSPAFLSSPILKPSFLWRKSRRRNCITLYPKTSCGGNVGY